jgi:hypothetical protein
MGIGAAQNQRIDLGHVGSGGFEQPFDRIGHRRFSHLRQN